MNKDCQHTERLYSRENLIQRQEQVIWKLIERLRTAPELVESAAVQEAFSDMGELVSWRAVYRAVRTNLHLVQGSVLARLDEDWVLQRLEPLQARKTISFCRTST